MPDAAVGKLLGLSPPLGAELCYLELGGYAIELIHFSAPEAAVQLRERTMGEVGLSHLSVSVDDIRAAADRAVECGGSIVESSDLGVALKGIDQARFLACSGPPSLAQPSGGQDRMWFVTNLRRGAAIGLLSPTAPAPESCSVAAVSSRSGWWALGSVPCSVRLPRTVRC